MVHARAPSGKQGGVLHSPTAQDKVLSGRHLAAAGVECELGVVAPFSSRERAMYHVAVPLAAAARYELIREPKSLRECSIEHDIYDQGIE